MTVSRCKLHPPVSRVEFLLGSEVKGESQKSLTVLSGGPGTFSNSQRPVHPTSRARRGRFRGSGGGSTTEERSQVKSQKSLQSTSPFRAPPLPSPSPSLSVSIILEPRQLLSSPETQSNYGAAPPLEGRKLR